MKGAIPHQARSVRCDSAYLGCVPTRKACKLRSLLLVQSTRVILTNVCNWRRPSIGAHAASRRKPSLGTDTKDAPLRQIDRLAVLFNICRADSQLDHRGFLW